MEVTVRLECPRLLTTHVNVTAVFQTMTGMSVSEPVSRNVRIDSSTGCSSFNDSVQLVTV